MALPKSPSLTRDNLKSELHYDPKTGIFTRNKASGRSPVGAVLGQKPSPDGYPRVAVLGKQYLAHRLAWFYMHGEWPNCQIDHANGDRADNRWDNLRSCTISENRWNSRKKHWNSSGLKGVCWDKSRRKWVAQIMAHRRHKYIGRFTTKEEAHAAYKAVALKLHGEFARIA